MADILPADSIKIAKAWLHDVFVWGGLSDNPRRVLPIEKYRYMYGTHPDNFRREDKKYHDAAVTICNCIRNRQVETQRFMAFDGAIKTLSACTFLPGLNETKGCVHADSQSLCNFIAWFCSENNLVYNNKETSIEEMKQIKNLQIGKTLWDNYLFAVGNTPENRPNNNNTLGDSVKKATPADTASQAVKTAPATPAGNTTPTTPATGGPSGHTLYRKNAAGILTQGKLTDISNNGYVYWIGGEFVKAGKTQPKLHVKPQYGSNPLKVDYGSGQGYNDCILYFASEQAAKNFMGIADAKKPTAKVKSLQVKRIGEDKNGYVEVATEFGNAYIKASKLHEEVEEDLNKEDNKVSNKEVWEAYKDGFFRE